MGLSILMILILLLRPKLEETWTSILRDREFLIMINLLKRRLNLEPERLGINNGISMILISLRLRSTLGLLKVPLLRMILTITLIGFWLINLSLFIREDLLMGTKILAWNKWDQKLWLKKKRFKSTTQITLTLRKLMRCILTLIFKRDCLLGIYLKMMLILPETLILLTLRSSILK